MIATAREIARYTGQHLIAPQTAADLVVDTAAATPAEAARQIASALPELPGALPAMN